MENLSLISIKALKAANLFSSSERTRYYLNGVLVTVARRHSTYVATDGSQLFAHREELPAEAQDNTLLGEWIFPADTIAKIKAEKYAPDLAVVTAFGKDKFLLQQAGADEIVVKPIDGTFPDWRRNLPSANNPEDAMGRAQIQPAHVASFTKAGKYLGHNTPHFHYGAIGNPCAVTFDDARKTFGVVMPMRNQAELWNGAPDWVNARDGAPTAQAAE